MPLSTFILRLSRFFLTPALTSHIRGGMAKIETGGQAHRRKRIEAPIDAALERRIEAAQKRFARRSSPLNVTWRATVIHLLQLGLDADEKPAD